MDGLGDTLGAWANQHPNRTRLTVQRATPGKRIASPLYIHGGKREAIAIDVAHNAIAIPYLAQKVWRATWLPETSALNPAVPVVSDYVIAGDAIRFAGRLWLESAPVIFYDETGTPDELWFVRSQRALVGLALEAMAPDTPVLARLIGDNEYKPITHGDLYRQRHGELRFRYSYLVNFAMIGLPLLHSALGTANPLSAPGDVGKGIKLGDPDCGFRTRLESIGKPSTIFTLFAIAAAHPDELALVAHRHAAGQDLPITLSPYIIAGSAVGTGKYAPSEGFLTSRCDVVNDLKRAGLVSITDGGLRVTEAGRRFLDLIGKTCFDPDILCRWASPGNFFSEGDAAARDAWIVRHFRAMARPS